SGQGVSGFWFARGLANVESPAPSGATMDRRYDSVLPYPRPVASAGLLLPGRLRSARQNAPRPEAVRSLGVTWKLPACKQRNDFESPEHAIASKTKRSECCALPLRDPGNQSLGIDLASQVLRRRQRREIALLELSSHSRRETSRPCRSERVKRDRSERAQP